MKERNIEQEILNALMGNHGYCENCEKETQAYVSRYSQDVYDPEMDEWELEIEDISFCEECDNKKESYLE